MAEMRKRPRKRPQKRERSVPEQDVNLVPPAPVNRKQVILVIASVVAVAVAIFLGLSIFFKMDADQFRVQGNQMYSADTIWNASGFKDGDNLLAINRAGVASRIMQQLPYIKSVQFQITLPDTVLIRVEEYDIYLSVADEDGGQWLISADGKKVLGKAKGVDDENAVILMGLCLKDPSVGQAPVAVETESNPVYTDSDRLASAVEIAQALERNEILGNVVKIDVSNLNDIAFQYEDRFLVKLGDRSMLSDKIDHVGAVILTQTGDRDTGILHVSAANGIQVEIERRKMDSFL